MNGASVIEERRPKRFLDNHQRRYYELWLIFGKIYRVIESGRLTKLKRSQFYGQRHVSGLFSSDEFPVEQQVPFLVALDSAVEITVGATHKNTARYEWE